MTALCTFLPRCLFSHPDLDQRDLRDRAGGKRGEIDFEIVGVEPHRDVELKAGGHRGAGRRQVAGREGDDAGGGIAGERRGGCLDAADRDTDAAGGRLGDGAYIGREAGAVGFDELIAGARAVADADALIERRHRRAGRGGAAVQPVAPAEAGERAAALLKESTTCCSASNVLTP